MKAWMRMGTGLLVLLAPVMTGCVSQAGYRQAIADREAEIRDLREERSSLKEKVQDLKGRLEDCRLEVASGASMPVAAAPAPVMEASAQSFPELDSYGITYDMRNGQMVISVPSSITFRSGSADLSAEGKKALRSVANTLTGEYGGANYYIEGHTDSDPIKKSKFGSNRELSLARAMAVLTYMVENCSVPDSSCKVVGHGEYEPVGPNDSKASKARNRRVEIVVTR